MQKAAAYLWYYAAPMLRQAFSYHLPEDLIAQEPTRERCLCRLLCLNGKSGAVEDHQFSELPRLLAPGDLLVFNDTRVIPARLRGKKDSGGQVEVLVERVLDERRALAMVRASKRPQQGSRLCLERTVFATITSRHGEFLELEFEGPRSVLEILEEKGSVPLPPYIRRHPNDEDLTRYQTVYARHPGAVAAPTAGLHFDDSLLAALRDNGIEYAFTTLHVGAGTFQPVRVDRLDEHRMHREYVKVSSELCEAVMRTRSRGGRVLAVGTTVVRGLETASQSGNIAPFVGDTDIFIYPGYRFHSIDGMITNFHLPESTLLMLVCAFGGYDNVMGAYAHAVAQRYRFFSYGDAMLIWAAPPPPTGWDREP